MQKDKTPYKILHILKDGQFHSGEDLGHQLNMTRSAIWKAVKQLTSNGITIQSITGRGYRIEGGVDLLDAAAIEKTLTANTRKNCHVDVLDQVTSTNDYLLQHKAPSTTPYHAVLAEQQTQGRGRLGRTWVSPYGNNIYLSLAWCSRKDPLELSGLSLAVAVAIIQALADYGITEGLNVKWPNDVLYDNNKLAGVLVELISESHSQTTVVIGIGMNTFLSPMNARDIDQPWISINDITHKKVDRNQLAALLLNQLTSMLDVFAEHGFEPFLKTWSQYDSYSGKPIVLSNGDTRIHGTMQGITEQGELLIKNKQQQLQKIMSGEMSLRKV